MATCRLEPYLLMALSVVLSACALDYSHDTRYLNWMQNTENNCVERYGPLPIDTPEQRKEFLKLGHQTFINNLDPEVYYDRLMLKYPNHRMVISCLADAFPRPLY